MESSVGPNSSAPCCCAVTSLYIIHGEYRPKKGKATGTRDCSVPRFAAAQLWHQCWHRHHRQSEQNEQDLSCFTSIKPDIYTEVWLGAAPTSPINYSKSCINKPDLSQGWYNTHFSQGGSFPCCTIASNFFIHTFQVVQQMRWGNLQIFSERLKARSQREKKF